MTQKHIIVQSSVHANGELGLFAAQTLKKGTRIGTYNGIVVPMKEYMDIQRSKQKYVNFIRKYEIETSLSVKKTRIEMSRLNFCLDKDHVVVMPKYPLSAHVEFYKKYNPMIFVNEPSHSSVTSATLLSVCAYTNFVNSTIDYVTLRDVNCGEELLVYYGNQYERANYQVDLNACNVEENKVFFDA